MSKHTVRAEKGTGFHAPRFSKRMFAFARAVGPAYNRYVEGIGGIQVHGIENLYRRIRDFQDGKSRLILLFRHAVKADGPVILQTVVKELPAWCRKARNRLQAAPHTHFLYGKDVLNWAGLLARWVFPGIGGIPVVNGRVEKESNSVIRDILLNGDFPLAFAPEGQVTYHSYCQFPLSQGTSKLAVWTHTDLRRANRSERVIIQPIAIGYRYHKDQEQLLQTLNAQLSVQTGLPRRAHDNSRDFLMAATGTLIEHLESAYRASYPGLVDFGENLPVQRRIKGLCDQILKCIESAIGCGSQGTILDRIFRTRYWIMDGLHREDIEPDGLVPAARGLADHRAAIAKSLDIHQQIVDILEYVHPEYISGYTGTTRMVEYAMNLLDICNRMKGGNIDSRYKPRRVRPHVMVSKGFDASTIVCNSRSQKNAAAKIQESVGAEFERLMAALEPIVEEQRV